MGKQLRKSQVSMEFVFLIGLAFTVSLVFTSSTRSEFDELHEREKASLLKDTSVMIQHEFVIASTVEDGYIRTFYVPLQLEGVDYTIDIDNNTNLLLSSTDDYEYVLNLPSINGNIQKEYNTIRKIDGVIYLN